MWLRVVTLKYSDGLQGFAEEAIRQAASGRELLEVRDHFFIHGGVPHLTLMLLLSETTSDQKRLPRRSTEDPGKDLPEQLQKLYRDLRNWRNERAKKDGIPSYVVMRNAQIVEICRRQPRTLADLKEIDGIGEATCAKYGKDILTQIPKDQPATTPEGDKSEGSP